MKSPVCPGDLSSLWLLSTCGHVILVINCNYSRILTNASPLATTKIITFFYFLDELFEGMACKWNLQDGSKGFYRCVFNVFPLQSNA